MNIYSLLVFYTDLSLLHSQVSQDWGDQTGGEVVRKPCKTQRVQVGGVHDHASHDWEQACCWIHNNNIIYVSKLI